MSAASPVAQALDWSFRLATVAVSLLAILWLVAGVRVIEPGQQAVVLRFGEVRSIVDRPGPVFAWPDPIEQVLVLPSAERQLQLPVHDFADGQDRHSVLLTGDGGMVHADCTVTYRVADPVAYACASGDLDATLRRCASRSLVHVAASASVDELLIHEIAAAREAVALDLGQRLAALPVSPGIAIVRVELTTAAPPAVRPHFDRAQAALAEAGRRIAQSEADATRRRRQGRIEADRLRQEAEGIAAELLATASERTDVIAALAQTATGPGRMTLLAAERADRLRRLLRRLERLILVAPDEPVRLRLPLH